jgi:L-ornithine Nalpha-acyltransferase
MTINADFNLIPALGDARIEQRVTNRFATAHLASTRLGALHTRLAVNAKEIEMAQRLRHAIFHKHDDTKSGSIDADQFDDVCDHLLIIDAASPAGQNSLPDGELIGAARLLGEDGAAAIGGYYSETEFTLRGLRQRQPAKRFLEIGRTCVAPSHRSKRAAELMWAGIWSYAVETGADVLVGCASLPGTIPAAHAQALSYMHHHHRAGGQWRAKALPERRSSMDLMPLEAINLKAALNAMPPLLKAYLRVGAMIGDGCVVDYDFGTTDVFVVLPIERIAARYIRHYGASAERFAA